MKNKVLMWMFFSLGFAMEAKAENQEFETFDKGAYERNLYDDCCNSNCAIYQHPLRLSIGAIAGDGLGCDNRRYATFGLFYAPCYTGRGFQTFIEGHGHYLKDNKWAANAGIGLRYLDCCASRVYGANLFYDYRQECFGSFNQIGFGIETLSQCFDLRMNAYFPLNDKHSRSQVFNDFIGDFFAVCKRSDFGLTGADAEIGRHFYYCDCNAFGFYAGVGSYYYRHKENLHFWGGMIRLKALYTEYAAIEVIATFDHVYHTNVQGIFTLSLPFELFTNPCELATNLCQSLLLEPVVRNNVITIDKRCCWRSNF